MLLALANGTDIQRLFIIATVAVVAHIAVLLVRSAARWLAESYMQSIAKAQTLTRFFASVLVFVIYFVAIGFALVEIGVPLGTYLASASIIGLAVSFGSQSLVQDVIGGLTLILGGLLDIGSMVDIGGQTGTVERIGIRYTVIKNFQGATISIPNRNVTNVTRFPRGHVRAYVDVRLPDDTAQHAAVLAKLEQLCESARFQFTGIILLPPVIAQLSDTRGQRELARIKFRIWPGQGAVLESSVRQRILATMRRFDDAYQDWMVSIHYRVAPAAERKVQRMFPTLRRSKTQGQ
jgi:small-conductance mechanosensitive channel